jgi:hypothetical protein
MKRLKEEIAEYVLRKLILKISQKKKKNKKKNTNKKDEINKK